MKFCIGYFAVTMQQSQSLDLWLMDGIITGDTSLAGATRVNGTDENSSTFAIGSMHVWYLDCSLT